jgi:hypothetical protein
VRVPGARLGLGVLAAFTDPAHSSSSGPCSSVPAAASTGPPRRSE